MDYETKTANQSKTNSKGFFKYVLEKTKVNTGISTFDARKCGVGINSFTKRICRTWTVVQSQMVHHSQI